ncbi:MAG: PH domain-containing protein [bacterium]|nr:PH domain-containing protein [bacterium]
MGKVYKMAMRFKNKYPMTIGWRIKQNASVIEKHLNPDEEVIYVFVAQKNDNPFDIVGTAVIALTNKRILIGRKRVVFGYFLDSITPDMFNDLKVRGGIFWGKVYVDTINELVVLSNIANGALPEIETELSTYMIEMNKNKRKDEYRD